MARGFRIVVVKWTTLVRLLLGEIPEKSLFLTLGMRKALLPYMELANAVRLGDLAMFQSVTEKYAATFQADKVSNLITRLRQNVIRIGA